MVTVDIKGLPLVRINLAHSSAMLVCEPLGDKGMVEVLPPALLSAVVAVVVSELLSCAGPLLM